MSVNKVQIEKVDNRVRFTFTQSSHYQYNGTAEWPINSLSMVIDESDMVTFKNAAGDIVYSITLADLEKTKAEMEELYAEAFVGGSGGGVSPEEVEEMIYDVTDPIVDIIDEKEEVVARALTDLHENKQDKLTAGSGITISGNVISAEGGSSVTVDPTLDSGSTNPVANSAITAAMDVKQNILTAGSGISINNDVISVTVDPTLDSGSTNPVANSAITTAIDAKANKSAAIGSYFFGTSNNIGNVKFRSVNNNNVGNPIYYPTINGKEILTSNQSYASNNYLFSLVETSAITSSMTASSTNAQVPSAKAVYDQLGGLKLVKCTQAEYYALVQGGTVDADTLYVITNVV